MKLKSITIQDKEIILKNLVLIVGANSTGKTRFLQDLNFFIKNNSKGGNLWEFQNKEIETLKKDKHEFFNNLTEESSERDGKSWYLPFSNDNKKYSDKYYAEIKNNTTQIDDNDIIKAFIEYLPVERRLKINGETQKTLRSLPPNDPLNLLFRERNSTFFKNINEKFSDFFGKNILISDHRDPQLDLYTYDSKIKKLGEIVDMNNNVYKKTEKWIEDNKILKITNEGHGIISLFNILLSLCTQINKIIMIDEPEIHLYPSLKNKLGKLIGRLSREKQIFCVTHDNDFLQGILDSKEPCTIIKLNKNKNKYYLTISQYNSSKLKTSEVQGQFLKIPFVEFVIIVEGADDRYFYEYISTEIGLFGKTEFAFIPAGGKDSIQNPEKLANDLGVPYCIILDFDALKDNSKKKNKNNFDKYLRLKNNAPLIKRIKQNAINLKGIENLTIQGLEAINDKNVKSETQNIINKLTQFGIFIVPIGTLESWIKNRSIKDTKILNYFIKTFSINKYKELVKFMKKIHKYKKGILDN
jgi:predicted ATPase